MRRQRPLGQRALRACRRYTTELGAAYQGDSLRLLTAVPEGSVQAVITSPPFALKTKKQYGNPTEDEYLDWFLAFVPELRRVLAEDGSLVIDIGGAWMPGSPTRSIYQFELLIAWFVNTGSSLRRSSIGTTERSCRGQRSG